MSYRLSATKNYDLFEVYDINRNVETIKKLATSMKKHGFIPAYPLHCVRNGDGKLRIKDGHHRFHVAKLLNISVYYIVCDDDAPIHELAGCIIKWSLQDFLVSYSRCEIEHYVTVKEYIERTGINIRCAISMLGGHTAGSGGFTETFKAGTYKIKSTYHAELVASIVLHCKAANVKFATHSLFVSALSHIAMVKEFDLTRFLHKIDVYSELMKKQPHMQGYMEMIESIYNRGSHDKIPLVFMAKQSARERMPKSVRHAG